MSFVKKTPAALKKAPTLGSLRDQFYEGFPERKDNVFFLLKGEEDRHKSVFSAMDIFARKNGVSWIGRKIYAWQTWFYFQKERPMSTPLSKPENGTPVIVAHTITLPLGGQALATAFRERACWQKSPTKKDSRHWLAFIFDHETAHALIPIKAYNTLSPSRDARNFSESAADAYALMRHLQRFGDASSFPARVLAKRIIAAVHHNQFDHHTAAALEMVLALRDKKQVQRLSPQETLKIAVTIAHHTALESAAKNSLSDTFNNHARKALENPALSTLPEKARVLSATLSAGLDAESPAVLKTVKNYLLALYAHAKEVPLYPKPVLEDTLVSLLTHRRQDLKGLKKEWAKAVRVCTKAATALQKQKPRRDQPQRGFLNK